MWGTVDGPDDAEERKERPRESKASECFTKRSRTEGERCIPDRSKSARKVCATLSSEVVNGSLKGWTIAFASDWKMGQVVSMLIHRYNSGTHLV